MADLQSAVSSASPMGSPIAAATPMGMGVKVVGAVASKRDANGMGRTGHGIPDGDDDIGVDSDDGFDEELEDQEQKPKMKTPLRHTSGYAQTS